MQAIVAEGEFIYAAGSFSHLATRGEKFIVRMTSDRKFVASGGGSK
jgi:hypothetical protein